MISILTRRQRIKLRMGTPRIKILIDSMRTYVAPMLKRIIGKRIKAFACNNRHFAIVKNGICGTGQLMYSGGFCGFISEGVTSDPDIEHLEDV